MSGSYGQSQNRSGATDKTPKIYKRERKNVLAELNERVRGNVRGLEGPFVAPITQNETEALGALKSNVFGEGGVGAAADAQLLDTLSGKTNPFLPQAIDAAITPILRNAELQELRDRALFTGAGQKIQGSTAFTEDRARSIADTERNVGDVASQIAYDAYVQERRNQLEAVSLANQRFAEQREGIAALALPRLIEQLGIDRGNAELQRRFQIIEQTLLYLGELTAPRIAGTSHGYSVQSSGGVTGGGSSSPGGGVPGGE